MLLTILSSVNHCKDWQRRSSWLKPPARASEVVVADEQCKRAHMHLDGDLPVGLVARKPGKLFLHNLPLHQWLHHRDSLRACPDVRLSAPDAVWIHPITHLIAPRGSLAYLRGAAAAGKSEVSATERASWVAGFEHGFSPSERRTARGSLSLS